MERALLWMGMGLVVVGLLTASLGVLLGAVGKGGGRLLPGDMWYSGLSLSSGAEPVEMVKPP